VADITYCVNDSCPLWQKSACERWGYDNPDGSRSSFDWDIRKLPGGLWVFYCDHYLPRVQRKKDTKK
jgi:hypothetical protein